VVWVLIANLIQELKNKEVSKWKRKKLLYRS
jgi:hypothetical protein